jgi:hypothetical protein
LPFEYRDAIAFKMDPFTKFIWSKPGCKLVFPVHGLNANFIAPFPFHGLPSLYLLPHPCPECAGVVAEGVYDQSVDHEGEGCSRASSGVVTALCKCFSYFADRERRHFGVWKLNKFMCPLRLFDLIVISCTLCI